MGSHIFGIWGIRNLKMGRLLLRQCVNSFQDDLVKRLYKVDA